MVFFLTIVIVYAAVLLYFCLGFVFYPNHKSSIVDCPDVCIVIAARNEEDKILACLRSIDVQDYKGKLEIILVDDASNDRTFTTASEYLNTLPHWSKIIRNEKQEGKKASLQKAIALGRAEIIVTRDADTFTTDPAWLRTIVTKLLSAGSAMVIAPITINTHKGIISFFEWLENAVLTVIAGGACFYRHPFLASGANLAFKREAFEKVNGYSSHLHIPSGDDVYLLRDLTNAGEKISYSNHLSSVVATYAAPNLSSLLMQKARWSSKALKGSGVMSLLLALLILAANLLWIFSAIMYFGGHGKPVFLGVLLVKFFADTLISLTGAVFFKKPKMVFLILPMAIVYPFYSLIVSVAALFYKPRWK